MEYLYSVGVDCADKPYDPEDPAFNSPLLHFRVWARCPADARDAAMREHAECETRVSNPAPITCSRVRRYGRFSVVRDKPGGPARLEAPRPRGIRMPRESRAAA